MQAVEQLAAAADERQALAVLLGARALADEHQVGVGVAHAEHDLRAALGQAAPRAGRRLGGDQLERAGHAGQMLPGRSAEAPWRRLGSSPW